MSVKKPFIIGNFEEMGDRYALVFAKNEESALNKLKGIKVGDKVDCYDNKQHVISEDDMKLFEEKPINTEKITELKSDIFILTNE